VIACVATIFEQQCVLGPNDQRLVLAKLEYVGEVEEMIKLNYEVLNFVVLVCNWVKTHYITSNPMVKEDEYGFTFVNFAS
jgi:hypothetical protein